MAKEKICGIYCIKNKVDNKVYIGQSININNRLANHKSDLKHNRHHNTYLQHAYNKYGVENFEFSIICECDMKELDKLEKYYILEVYNSVDRNNGYNRESGGNLRKIVSQETREKISKAGKERFKNPDEIEKNRKRQLKRFENPEERVKMKIAQKKRYEDPIECIKDSEARLKFYASEDGQQWIKNYKETMSKYWNDECWKEKMIMSSKAKSIVQLTLDMKLIKIWLSEKQITRELKGFYRNNIHNCLVSSYGFYGNGYKNFIWLYQENYEKLSQKQIDEYIVKFQNFNFSKAKFENASISRLKNRVVQLNLDMSFVKIWNGINEPEREGTQFYRSPIRRCCIHKTQSYKGFIWMYEKEYNEFLESQTQDSFLLCSNV